MPKCVRASQRVVVYVLGALLLLVVGAKRLQAQAVTGNISGTVTDSSGGVIAGANIQVKNTGTGVTQTTTSNSQGRYNVPDLTVGTYDVQASNSGFQTVVHAGVNLTVGSQLTVDLSIARRPGPADSNGRDLGRPGRNAIDRDFFAHKPAADGRSASKRPQLRAAAQSRARRHTNRRRNDHTLWNGPGFFHRRS